MVMSISAVERKYGNQRSKVKPVLIGDNRRLALRSPPLLFRCDPRNVKAQDRPATSAAGASDIFGLPLRAHRKAAAD